MGSELVWQFWSGVDITFFIFSFAHSFAFQFPDFFPTLDLFLAGRSVDAGCGGLVWPY